MDDLQMDMFSGSTSPVDRVESACRWLRDFEHHCAFMRLMDVVDAQPGHVRRGDVWVLAQQAGMSVSDCEMFRFDNNLWSVLSRYMLMMRPRLATKVHPRRCDVDTVDLELVYRRSVSTHTTFPCHTWDEAVMVCRRNPHKLLAGVDE